MPNPFFGLLPTTAVGGAAGPRTSRASGCCGRIRSSTPSTRRPTRASRGTTRSRSTRQRGSPTATRCRVSYTYSHFNEATEFLNAGDPEPWKGISSRRHAAPAHGQRHLRAAVRPRPPLRRRDVTACVGGAHRRLAVLGDLHLPERLPDRLRQHHLHRQPRRHRAAGQRADGRPLVQHRRRLQQGRHAAARIERPHVPASARERAHRQRSTTSTCRSSRTRTIAGKTLQLRFDSLNAFNHPSSRGAGHQPDREHVRADQRVDAGQLRAPDAGVGEVPLLSTVRSHRLTAARDMRAVLPRNRLYKRLTSVSAPRTIRSDGFRPHRPPRRLPSPPAPAVSCRQAPAAAPLRLTELSNQ